MTSLYSYWTYLWKHYLPVYYKKTSKFVAKILATNCGCVPSWWVMEWKSSIWGNLYFLDKFDLKGQGQLPPKRIYILTKAFCTPDPNLVILAWTVDEELQCGQVQDWVGRHDMHTHMDRLMYLYKYIYTYIRTDMRSQQQHPKAKTGLG